MNQLINKHQEANGEYEKEYGYYQELVDEFNKKYVGEPLSEESQMLDDKMVAQLAVAKELEGRYNQLYDLIADQQKELENISSQVRILTD